MLHSAIALILVRRVGGPLIFIVTRVEVGLQYAFQHRHLRAKRRWQMLLVSTHEELNYETNKTTHTLADLTRPGVIRYIRVLNGSTK
ncbi:hypothetical protein PR001_g16806 [Phytophthora rubi]|uniref:Secreted protein n=1 Tax=Phytophthora rubi TaxID=129364 RepID=A0A6A3KQS5_9STRA|nr:hypothetical protein PR002_g19592 [Phytophthora rubi]KAE9008057.1 hypothetical protein PR001_g16806 [Phytophthora rubi]